MDAYWYCPCVACRGQGRLVIMRNRDTEKLFLHCDECMRAWDNPRDVHDVQKCASDFRENYESVDLDEIQTEGWGGYAKKEYIK